MAVKEERRARVQKIMGGGDKKPSPKITAENLLPTKPGGGARITSEQVQSLHIVNIKLGEVSNGLKDQLVLSKVREGIKKRSHLNHVLNKWKCLYEDKGEKNPYKKDSIFVVPADVHF